MLYALCCIQCDVPLIDSIVEIEISKPRTEINEINT